MANSWPYHAGGCKKNECDHIENTQLPFFSDQLYASTASSSTWTATNTHGWDNVTLPTTRPSMMPTSVVPQQQHTYLNPSNSTYEPHTFVHGQFGTATISPQGLQVPTFARQPSYESPFVLSPYDADDGMKNDAEYGLSIADALSNQDTAADEFAHDGLPTQYLDAMNPTHIPTNQYPGSVVEDPDETVTLSNSAGKKKKRRLTKTQTTILRNWFYLHIDNPYPDANEMSQLQAETQLSLDQVRNWFARSRQRQLPGETTVPSRMPVQSHQQPSGSTMPFRGRNSPNSAEGFPESFHHHHHHRYEPQSQPIENDTMDSFINGDMNAHGRGVRDRVSRNRAPTITIDTSHLMPDDLRIMPEESQVQTPMTASPTNLAPDYSDAGSEYDNPTLSRRNSCRSISSFKSCRTHQSNHSGSSIGIHGSRRGRRRMTSGSRSPSEASSLRDYVENPNDMITHGTGGDEFCCQLCSETFTRKSTLKRHLQTIHGLEKRPWICYLPDLGTEYPQCFFCLMGGLAQVCPHRMDACEQKSEKDRSFWRKDHFMQHLEGVHKISKDFVRGREIDLNQWRSSDMVTATSEGGTTTSNNNNNNNMMPSRSRSMSSAGRHMRRTTPSGWNNFVEGPIS